MYRAIYKDNSCSETAHQVTTRYYSTRSQAQRQLAKRIGHFPLLGKVSGDGFDGTTYSRVCDGAARLGGWVAIIEK